MVQEKHVVLDQKEVLLEKQMELDQSVKSVLMMKKAQPSNNEQNI